MDLFRGIKPGETRPYARAVTVRFPVDVTVYWPIGIPYTTEDAIEAAVGMVHQSDELDVGPPAKIVWAKRWAECSTDLAEIVEDIEL